MILGIGADLCSIERIAASLDRFGDRFEAKVFTAHERAQCAGRPAAFAKRWAAKEACAKALRSGFRGDMGMTDIGVVNDPHGAPSLVLTGGAKARLDALVPAGHAPRIHLSLTDDHPWAQAFVVIETKPEQDLP